MGRSTCTLLWALLCAVAAPGAALADALADQFFRDARTAMAEGRYDAARALFERSLARDDAVGTRVNLEVARGRFAVARRLFDAAERDLEARGVDPGDERRTFVQRERAVLERRAPKLVVDADVPNTELEVELDGERLRLDSVGKPIVVDVGTHRIVARARGRRTERTAVAHERRVARVRIELSPAGLQPSTAGAPATNHGVPLRSSGPSASVWASGSIVAAGLVGAPWLAPSGSPRRATSPNTATSHSPIRTCARGRRASTQRRAVERLPSSPPSVSASRLWARASPSR